MRERDRELPPLRKKSARERRREVSQLTEGISVARPPPPLSTLLPSAPAFAPVHPLLPTKNTHQSPVVRLDRSVVLLHLLQQDREEPLGALQCLQGTGDAGEQTPGEKKIGGHAGWEGGTSRQGGEGGR